MMSGLSGILEAVGLQAIIGFLAGLRKSGTLRLVYDGWSGEVIFDRGEVVDAAFGAERGLAALDALALALPVGTFSFVEGPAESVPPEARTIDLSPQALQAHLEGVLESGSGAPAPALTPVTVPLLVPGDGVAAGEDGARKVALTRGAIQTLLAVDGQRSVAEIAAGRGFAETIKDLQALARQGLIAMPGQGVPVQGVPVQGGPVQGGPVQGAPGWGLEVAPVVPGAAPAALAAGTPAPQVQDVSASLEALPAQERPDNRKADDRKADDRMADDRKADEFKVDDRKVDDRGRARTLVEPPSPAEISSAWPAIWDPVAPPSAQEERPSTRPVAPAAERPSAEPIVPVAQPVPLAAVSEDNTCPKLGFADDVTRHFSRPTQIHRCFAGTNPVRIVTDDQQDFCLTGQFPTCARFAAAATSPQAVPDTLRPRGVAPDERGAPEEPLSGSMPEPAPSPVAGSSQPLSRERLPAARAGSVSLMAGAGNGALESPPDALEPAPLDRGRRWTPAALVGSVPPGREGAGAADGGAVVPLPETDAAPPAPPVTLRDRRRPSAPPVVGGGGAPARPAGDGALQRLRGSRTQLLLGLATIGIAAALLAPVLMRPPEDVPVQPAPLGTAGPDTTPAAAVSASPGTPVPTPRALRTVFDDRFVNSQGSWPNNPESSAWFAEGAYRLLARQAGQFVAIGAPLRERFRDVVVTGAFRKVSGPVGGGYGLIVRDQGPGARDGASQVGRFYVFEVGDKGEVGIWRRDGDKWIDILPWTPSGAVSQGNSANTLSVQALGPQLTFSVNGQVVSSQTDTNLQEGSVGIFVGGDGNEVVIERFLVQVPS